MVVCWKTFSIQIIFFPAASGTRAPFASFLAMVATPLVNHVLTFITFATPLVIFSTCTTDKNVSISSDKSCKKIETFLMFTT